MSIGDEPVETGQPGQELETNVELFPVGLKMSELVADYCQSPKSDRLAEIVISEGGANNELSENFYRQVALVSDEITQKTEADWKRAVNTPEERPLQVRQQVLRQVGQIVLLLDTYWKIYDAGREELADKIKVELDELVYGLLDDLDQLSADGTLGHKEYFQSIKEKVEGLRS